MAVVASEILLDYSRFTVLARFMAHFSFYNSGTNESIRGRVEADA